MYFPHRAYLFSFLWFASGCPKEATITVHAYFHPFIKLLLSWWRVLCFLSSNCGTFWNFQKPSDSRGMPETGVHVNGISNPRLQPLVYCAPWRGRTGRMHVDWMPVPPFGLENALVTVCAQARPTLQTPGTLACQVPLPKEFSRQEYWSRLLFPPSGCLPEPGIKLTSSGRWILYLYCRH